MAHVSVKQTLLFACRTLLRAGVWYRIILPALLGGLALYVSFDLYLLELQHYLVHPTERLASLVLGVATAGLLLTLFMHSVTVAAVTSLSLERPDKGWTCFCVSRRSWRIYAAYLRFLLVCAVFVVVVEFLRITAAGAVPLIGAAAGVLMIAGLFFLIVRAGFLIAPIASATSEGPIVRQAWKLTSPVLLQLATVLFVTLLIGFAIEALGEVLLAFAVRYSPIGAQPTLLNLVTSYRTVLPATLIVVGIAYLPTVVLLSAAAASCYRQIVEPANAAGTVVAVGAAAND